MKSLEQLDTIAQEAMGGLTAGQDLKYRIQKAVRDGKRPAAKSLFRPMPVMALSAALVVFVAGAVLFPRVLTQGAAPVQTNKMFDSLPAGQSTTQPKVRALLDIPPGSITLSSNNNPEYRSIWASADGSNFPLVGINGKFYRLMRNPSSIPDNLLGQSLGQVTEYTDEPALADASQIISNTISQGEAVYAVSGMESAMVAAMVDGTMRAFQRVSFANNATVGQENLADTLGIAGQVSGLELSGVGTVTNEAAANDLVRILLDNASFASAGSSQNSGQALLIQLSNGLVVQMLVKNDTVSACGSWTCPEFFEAFLAAVQ